MRYADQSIESEVTAVLRRFWADTFGYEGGDSKPTLEDHFTLVDVAANSGHNLGKYDPTRLRAIRRLSIHRVLHRIDVPDCSPSNAARHLIEAVAGTNDGSIITTNWDVATEQILRSRDLQFDYGPHVTNQPTAARSAERRTPLAKLHGSSNWIYCDLCRSTFAGMTDRPVKTALYVNTYLLERDLRLFDQTKHLKPSRSPSKCERCGIETSARIGTFSFQKALGFYPFHSCWHMAERQLQQSERWTIVGYSLPTEDYLIRSMLKTCQLARPSTEPLRIDVVCGPDEAAGSRFRSFFGASAEVHETTLSDWMASSGNA